MATVPHLPRPTKNWDSDRRDTPKSHTPLTAPDISQPSRQTAPGPEKLGKQIRRVDAHPHPREEKAGRCPISCWWMTTMIVLAGTIIYQLLLSPGPASGRLILSQKLMVVKSQLGAVDLSLQNWTQASSILPPLRDLETVLLENIAAVDLLGFHLGVRVPSAIKSALKTGECRHVQVAAYSAQNHTRETADALRISLTLYNQTLSGLKTAHSDILQVLASVRSYIRRELKIGIHDIGLDQGEEMKRINKKREGWSSALGRAVRDLQPGSHAIESEIKRYDRFAEELGILVEKTLNAGQTTLESQPETASRCQVSDLLIFDRLFLNKMVGFIENEIDAQIFSDYYNLL